MTVATQGTSGWRFWVDRGGTFTDVVAQRPDGGILTRKLLSKSDRYDDATVQGVRDLLGLAPDEPLPAGVVTEVRMGTTVATNALLTRRGEPTLLVTTRGFGDALRIGTQARPDIFAVDIVLPDMVYDRVVEVDERVRADGTVLRPLDVEQARSQLSTAFADGLRAVAIVLLHGYRHRAHEARLAELAAEVGFTQISASHEVNPLIRMVPRGDTTVADAYLSPVLRRHVDSVRAALDVPLSFMQSNGGLADADRFRGKDALLSGPAGGVVGMARTGEAAGHPRLIGFDMGGTSTDVSHYAGRFERTDSAIVAGVRVRAPMISMHTVAAGGGSILHFDGQRFRVGPDSAGADPGPACYGRGGPAALTDANVVLGRLHPDHFPAVFGPDGEQPLDVAASLSRLEALAGEVSEATGRPWTAAETAEGFLRVAVQRMAGAIKTISVQRGHDVSGYALSCFGGAGGQHACWVADELGITTVVVHPLAGLLSALGIGLADTRSVAERAVGHPLNDDLLERLQGDIAELSAEAAAEVAPDKPDKVQVQTSLFLRYEGSDTSLEIPLNGAKEPADAFEELHRFRFGFASPDTTIVVESLQVEALLESNAPVTAPDTTALPAAETVVRHTPVGDMAFHDRNGLIPGEQVAGPAAVVDEHTTVVVEPGWTATRTTDGMLTLRRTTPRHTAALGTGVDPVLLEVFNSLFSNVAEQMGVTLENTAASVNIKERLDFSCAVFGPGGELVANAPHIPVHLGSMDESVRAVMARHPRMSPGDAFVTNAPYDGGTHLPDVTVIAPVFNEAGNQVIFFVAARGHHADIGGTTPGSAPADSTSIHEEGVLLDAEVLATGGRLRETELRKLLSGAAWPARAPDLNIADMKAQLGACRTGAAELAAMVDRYGLDVVHAYMGHVRANAAESVRRVVDTLEETSFTAEADDGSRISVAVRPDRANRRCTIDFTGSSPQHEGNANAPRAVCRAAVLFVLRCLVDDDIPLNSGCLEPVDLVLPTPSIISPQAPAAVFAGNVETSQLIVDALFGAFGTAAASQGTMNNVVWGNEQHQYYETICGGAGATPRRDGCDAVHTAMTNSRLTDPEVLEWRFPVLLEDFSVRRGSGGSGQRRGGDGVVRRVRFEEAMTLNVLSGRRMVPPYGIAGGLPGAAGRNRVLRADGRVDDFGGTFRTEVAPGDVFEIATPGGGGYGPPKDSS